MSNLAISGAPAPPPPLLLVSASGKRMAPRVEIPLAVEFGAGDRRATRDWSVTGFSLRDDGVTSTLGAIHPVRLHFGLSGCEVAVDVDAKVSWMANGQARGFRFVGLDADKARIVDHFLQTGLEGDAAVVGGLPVTHRPNHAARVPGPVRAWTRGAAQAGKLALLAGTVLLGAGFVLSRLLTVTADYAAVSADLQQVHAPEAGYLRSDLLAVGTHLRAGQPIGALQPVATPQARLATETEIAALQATLDQQNAALDQARTGFATFLRASRTGLAEASAGRAMLEQQVAAEAKVYGRFVAMKAKGVVAEERVDQEQQVLLTLQRTLATARDLESAARQKLANADEGLYASDGRSTQKSPADLQQEARVTEATIARLKATLAALDQPLTIASPCDCTVTALAATPGAYVAAGAHLADLARDGDGTSSVDALVQTPRLGLVRRGQAVTVYLADRRDGVTGHVTAINFNPANTGRTGLPPSLRTLDDYGLMRVSLDAGQAGAVTGLPATVMAPIDWRALAATVPAAAWAQGVLDGAADRAGRLWAGLAQRLLPSRQV